MANAAAIVVPIVLILAIAVVLFFTWNWWKRTINRCLSNGNGVPPDAVFDPRGPPTFTTLDPTTLTNLRQGSDGSVRFEPLPTVHNFNVGQRESFEFDRTQFQAGIIPLTDSSSIYSHDWFHYPHESFPRTNLTYFEVRGNGWFGKVLEAEAKNISQMTNTRKVIVKQMRDDANDQQQMRFLNQCRIHRDTDNAHILKLLGFAVESTPYLAIFEYWPLGDLKSYLIGKEKSGDAMGMIQQGIIPSMAIDITKGLTWLFENGYAHEDLAARNCLVANTAGKVIIGDYGLSTQRFPKDYYHGLNQTVPVRWVAPETFDHVTRSLKPKSVTPMSNIWSFGILLWELYQFGNLPYADLSDEDVIQRVLKSKSYVIEPPTLPYFSDSAKDTLYKLMLSCWNSTPEHRPNIGQIQAILSKP